MSPQIGIVYSDEVNRQTCLSPKYSRRFRLVMGLLHAYKLTSKLVRIHPINKTVVLDSNILLNFHSEDYVKTLKILDSYYTTNEDPSIPDEISELFESCGLNYDCHGFCGVFDYALSAVRGTLAAVDCLINEDCQIAINWTGGWHHAKRNEASGFCYLNDIVLGAQRLLSSSAFSTSSRLLYIDLDLHHGDGVEEAFAYTSRVVTFSVHHGAVGFFPGTGVAQPENGTFFTGARGGRFSCFNLPLEGADDPTWWSAVEPVLEALHKSVKPAAIFVQCGADALTSDPYHTFNLSASLGGCSAYVDALRLVLGWKLPTLLLGGGGYHFEDTARLWTILTAVAISTVSNVPIALHQDIPDHDNLASFGPDFTLDVRPSMRLNQNSPEVVSMDVERLLDQVDQYCAFNGLNRDE